MIGPLFDGDERKFELWEIKFLCYLRLKKLDTIFTPLAEDTRAADTTKNIDAFAELIQCLFPFGILREHYRSKGKPRIITLYTELHQKKYRPGQTKRTQ